MLPYVVDCKDIPTQPVKDTDITDSFHMVINWQNPSIQVHSVATEQSVDTNEESGSCSGPHADSNAVVLDCRFCGASVGLWTFSMVPRPLELFKLVGYAEVNSNKNSELDSANENHVDNRRVIGNSASNGALSSMTIIFKFHDCWGSTPNKTELQSNNFIACHWPEFKGQVFL